MANFLQVLDKIDETQPASGISPFGDRISAELSPKVAIKATYGLIDIDTETFNATGGGVSVSNSEFLCQSGTSVGGYGTIWSRRPIVYVPGVGCEARITARFSAGASGYLQLAGLFSGADGMMFVQRDGNFGVMHRYGGSFAIRRLTLTVASGGTETITLIVDDVEYTLAVAASATVEEAAHDLAAAMEADSGFNARWYVNHIDDGIVIMYRGVGPHTGTYSIASTGTLAGSFTTLSTGVTPTEDITYQEDWNQDVAEWLDPTKGNLYRVEFAYLGYGPLNYYIMHPDTKRWKLVHQVEWPNAQTRTNLGNPSMRVGWAAASVGGSGTNVTVHGGSAMAALQGNGHITRPRHTAIGNKSSISTETSVISIKVRREFGGRACLGIVVPHITVATDSTKGMIFRMYLNPTVAGDTVHEYIHQTDSITIYDTAGTTVSGGELVYATPVGPSGRADLSTEDLGILLNPGDELVVTAAVTSGAASGAFVTVVGEEIR